MQGRKFYPVARVTSNRMAPAKYLFPDDFSSRFNWRENCFLYIRDSGFYQADRRYRWRTALRANCKMKRSTASEVTLLRNQPKERWRELCERVLVERDPQRFEATIQELLQALEDHEKQRRNVVPIRTPPGESLPT